jgi:threonine synthase
MSTALAAGWRCAVCDASVDIAAPMAWVCPNATPADRHHALELVQASAPIGPSTDPNPFVTFREHLAWDSAAAAWGMTSAARTAMVVELDERVATVAGTGFRTTPLGRADALSSALGFIDAGGVWVKDETGNVAGSHKARHLFTILLHLIAAETTGRAPWSEPAGRPPLAIASCGNAALAASTLAAAVAWPIRVFVPEAADRVVVDRLHELGAHVVTCPRLASDPPGDPCVHRFREAVADGAVPFSVQGTENVWCLDGGRTIGWELAAQLQQAGCSIDRVFVQVGGGAFATCVAAGLRDGGAVPRLHAVQTTSSAPLERAWRLARELGGATAAAGRWSECMWPWEQVGASAADGILDDETYDWLPVVRAIDDSGGAPVVVAERHVLEAATLVREHTSIDASATGTAGLAGLLAIRDQVADHEQVLVICSGVRRVR